TPSGMKPPRSITISSGSAPPASAAGGGAVSTCACAAACGSGGAIAGSSVHAAMDAAAAAATRSFVFIVLTSVFDLPLEPCIVASGYRHRHVGEVLADDLHHPIRKLLEQHARRRGRAPDQPVLAQHALPGDRNDLQ